jgi:hypothetical protein
MSDFVVQVAEALEAIPHDRDCPAIHERRPGYDGRYCICSREARRSVAVAAAIERLATLYVDDVWGGAPDGERYQRTLAARRADGLAALRTES